jgi:hypothetical protein
LNAGLVRAFEQVKTYIVFAMATTGKAALGLQFRFVHHAVGFVVYPIDPALGDSIAWLVFHLVFS